MNYNKLFMDSLSLNRFFKNVIDSSKLLINCIDLFIKSNAMVLKDLLDIKLSYSIQILNFLIDCFKSYHINNWRISMID